MTGNRYGTHLKSENAILATLFLVTLHLLLNQFLVCLRREVNSIVQPA